MNSPVEMSKRAKMLRTIQTSITGTQKKMAEMTTEWKQQKKLRKEMCRGAELSLSLSLHAAAEVQISSLQSELGE